jgi:hypothetical protein
MRYITTTLLLLACSTAVQAERSWVLWYRHVQKIDGAITLLLAWNPAEAFPEMSACQKRMKEKVKNFREMAESLSHLFVATPTIVISPPIITVMYQTDHQVDTTEYKCLPDAVKP